MVDENLRAADALARDTPGGMTRMQGTESQIAIVRHAIENRDETVGEIADTLEYSPQWVEQVLLRADDEFIEQYVGPVPCDNATASHRVLSAPQPGRTDSHVAVDGISIVHGQVAHIDWATPEGTMSEIETLEYCPECSEWNWVSYLVPHDVVTYAERPECGHKPRFDAPPPRWVEDVQHFREVIRSAVADMRETIRDTENDRPPS